jgi:hypothetical protein
VLATTKLECWSDSSHPKHHLAKYKDKANASGRRLSGETTSRADELPIRVARRTAAPRYRTFANRLGRIVRGRTLPDEPIMRPIAGGGLCEEHIPLLCDD